jgi:hypothetical protein
MTPMPAECSAKRFDFGSLDRRIIEADFGGGAITSNAGALLLGQLDRGLGLIRRFAACFTDRRNPVFVEHHLETLLGQRIFGLALGYEDLVDHDELRKDPVMAVLAGKLQSTRPDCEPLAGKSTLNRLEHASKNPAKAKKYHKIDCDLTKAEALLVDLFLEAHPKAPAEIVIDLDATDIPLHGHQEGRFFHGYYGHYCYLPLYIFCGDHLLLARQRRSNIDAAAGALEEVIRIVRQIRARRGWTKTRIILRADSGFCRDALMSWCEDNHVGYVFGLARNKRLQADLAKELETARTLCEASGRSARVFKDFLYQTLDSWSRPRRVVGKAEHTPQGSNPRFVVTNLIKKDWAAKALYEDLYCARGEAENRIGEQFELFADRASSQTLKANQLRLLFSAMAYTLIETLRRVALRHTQLANASANTIRLKLFKLGAQVRMNTRRIRFAIASSCPNQIEFELAHLYLRRAYPSP